MDPSSSWGFGGRGLVLGLLGLVAVAGAAVRACAEDAAAGAPGSEATRAGTAGMRIYRDPLTGRPTVPPPGARAVPPSPSFSTSAQGLLETPGPSPAGGVMLDLRGRFRNAMTLTRDADGKETTRCVPAKSSGKE